ncbi:hypothetical protein L596_020005 [Steinernema carpocapsae]|uniref:MARVEL domain-containing protein n=1 Tax=Steinernema carpocapsae TaxID=34508 RepID=A0A4U5MSW7_STECR|nr:hypothetical protein L596_020005 [Steinernema carpocapsae]
MFANEQNIELIEVGQVRVDKPHLKPPTCCCCLPVTTGAFIIAVLVFLVAGYTILGAVICLSYKKHHNYEKILFILLILLLLAICFFSLLAIAAIFIYSRHRRFLPFLVILHLLRAITSGIFVLSALICVTCVHDGEKSRDFWLRILISSAIALLFSIWFTQVVDQCYDYLKKRDALMEKVTGETEFEP